MLWPMPELNLAAADAMTAAAIAFATEHNWRLSIAVLDAGGNVLRITRMDGCNFLSPDIARSKALGAAAWKLASLELNSRFGSSPASAAGIVAASGGRIAPIQGALPVWDGDRCVGAIGASGARSDEDEAAVRAALLAAGFSDKPTG
jgi:glc operon protein GlcG